MDHYLGCEATAKFFQILFDKKLQDYRLGWDIRSEVRMTITRYLNKLEDEVFKKIISNPIWINYPTIVYGPFGKNSMEERKKLYASEKKSRFRYGPSISEIIVSLVGYSASKAKIVAEHSVGFILKEYLDVATGKDAVKAFNRGIVSPDIRVRKCVCRIGPISNLEKFKKDPRAEVRMLAFRRLGIKTAYQDFLNDRSNKIKYTAMASASLDEFDYEKVLESFRQKLKGNGHIRWVDFWALNKILSKLPKEKIIFHMDFKELVKNSHYQRNELDKLFAIKLS